MNKNSIELGKNKISGERARLIPVLAEGKVEERATSALLACLSSVEEFGRDLLSAIGAPVKKRSRITCLTEVSFFRGNEKIAGARPDGLIQILNGKDSWVAIVEAKAGNQNLEISQVEKYVDLAREFNLDSVVTISNEFTTRVKHHPVEIKSNKLRKVSLLHWSWTAIETEAVIHIANEDVNDSDQAYILSELIRFFEHPKSGVRPVTTMPRDWREVCTQLRKTGTCSKTAQGVISVVDSWQQLTRSMALKMSTEIGAPVDIYLPRAHAADSKLRSAHDASLLCDSGYFEDFFDIPDTADRVRVVANVSARRLTASMTLRPPTNKSRASATVTWIRKQLIKCEEPNKIEIIVKWPGRMADSAPCTLTMLEQNPDFVLAEDKTYMPSAFEIRLDKDLARTFDQPTKFVGEALGLLPDYYRLAGQYLKKWVPDPPKLKTEPPVKEAVETSQPILSNIEPSTSE